MLQQTLYFTLKLHNLVNSPHPLQNRQDKDTSIEFQYFQNQLQDKTIKQVCHWVNHIDEESRLFFVRLYIHFISSSPILNEKPLRSLAFTVHVHTKVQSKRRAGLVLNLRACVNEFMEVMAVMCTSQADLGHSLTLGVYWHAWSLGWRI